MADVSTDRPRRLADFLRRNRNRILDAWVKAVGQAGTARTLSRPLLLDHMPDFLDELADYVDGLRAGTGADAPRDNPQIHAVERLSEGYDLREVVEEYAVLRQCIVGLAARSRAAAVRSAELPLLHQAIDQAISTAVTRYSEARQRTLRSLDRISSIALVQQDLESLLPRLLDAFILTTASADSIALSLLEDGKLWVRAAVGFPAPSPVGMTLAPESFSARVVQTGELLVRNASADPDIAGSPSCAPGTQALYGIPLQLGEQKLGAVVMGSQESRAFSNEDQLLFRTMVNRAAELIAHADLHAQVARHAAQMESVMGVLSHDLRNPLGVILVSAQTVERYAKLDEVHQRAVSRISGNAKRIERMIRDLLDYTRGRLGREMNLSRRNVDLAAVCRQVIEDLLLLNPGRAVRLDAQGSTELQLDPDRAAQAVGNLVSNALKYGVHDREVTVTLRGGPAEVTMEVHNLGPAIPAALVPRVFDAFQRGGSAGEGLGLGLYIVRQIVSAHGGTVKVASSDRDGTVFTVRLPTT